MSDCAVKEVKRESTRDRLPRERVCPNEGCFGRTDRRGFGERFCSACGAELEERIGDLYIEIGPNAFRREEPLEQEYVDDHGPEKQANPPDMSRISLREFVRILKEYEKEVFVEDI